MSPLTADPDALRRRFEWEDNRDFNEREDAILDGMERDNMSDEPKGISAFLSTVNDPADAYAAGLLAGRQQQREIDAAVCRERAKHYDTNVDSFIHTEARMRLRAENEACAAAIEAGPLT